MRKFLALFVLLSQPVAAGTYPWLEGFEADPVMQQKIGAVGIWVKTSDLDCDATECSLELTPWVEVDDDPARPICPDLAYYANPHGSDFRSGVLVGQDLFLTVHQIDSAQCEARSVLFGFAAAGRQDPLVNQSSGTSFFKVPVENVVQCAGVVPGGDQGNGWQLVQLAKPMDGLKPLKIHRQDTLGVGSRAHVLGSPNRLSLKVSTGPILSMSSTGGSSRHHVLDGSSGSVVIGENRRVLGLVATGWTSWWWNDNGCERPSVTRLVSAGWSSPDPAAVPLLGLEGSVSSHVIKGPPGGPFSPSEIVVSLTSHQVPTDWSVRSAPIRRLEPRSISGSLLAGESAQISFEVAPEVAGLPVGEHPTRVRIRDVTFDTTDVFEILIRVEDPPQCLDCDDPNAPVLPPPTSTPPPPVNNGRGG